MENLINQLEEWKSLIQNNPSIPPDLSQPPASLPGISKQDIIDNLSTLIVLLRKNTKTDNSEIAKIITMAITGITFQLNSIKQVFSGNPLGYIPSIVEYIKQIYFLVSSLNAYNTNKPTEKILTQLKKDEAKIAKSAEDFIKNNENLTNSFENLYSTKQTELNEIISKNNAILKQAEAILGKTNQSGLAASFKEKIVELDIGLFLWGILLLVSVIAFGAIVWSIFSEIPKPNGNGDAMNTIATFLLIRSIVLLPFLIMIFIANRQYNITLQLKEEYGFKKALAMAFEGYKDEVSKTNDGKLVDDLILTLMHNLSRNPADIFEKKQTKIGLPIKKEN